MTTRSAMSGGCGIEGAHSIKNYNQPRRNQRQQVAAAARAENILVVPEGGSLFQMDVTLIQDGNSTVEHNIPQQRFYEDLVQPLCADPGRLQSDPGRHLWRPRRRSLLDAGRAGLAASPAHPPHPAGRARRAGARGDRAGRSVRRSVQRPRIAPARRSAACRSRSAATASSRAWPSIGNCGATSAAARPRSRRCATRPSTAPASTASPISAPRARQARRSRRPRRGSARSTSATPTTSTMVMLNGRLYDAATLNERVTGNRQRQPYYWERDGGAGAPQANGGEQRLRRGLRLIFR